MLNIPDLNRLKPFYYVYIDRSLVKTAARLNVTRSAISQSIKYLEEELSVSLFSRNSKAVSPTKAATRLFEIVDPFFRELSAGIKNLESERKEITGLIRVGAPVEFGAGKMTRLIAQFQKIYPKLVFELQLAIPVKQISLLLEDKLDIAFIDNGDIFEKSHPISLQYMAEENFILVASKEYYKKHLRKEHSLENLKAQRFVDYVSHGPVLKMWFKHHFKKNIQDIDVIFSAENVNAIINAIDEGLGLGVVPEYLVEKKIKSGELVKISIHKSELINKIALAASFDKRFSVAEKAFVKFCGENLKND